MTLRNAIDNHDIDKVRSILDDNDFSSKIMDKMLALAARNGHTDTVSLLILRGADIHMRDEYALRYAAQNGHTDTVELLLDLGTDIHALADYALRLAARNGRTDAVELLLDRGVNIHVLNDEALRWAARSGHTDTVELLLDRGANIHADDDYALRHAAENGHIETFWFLICRYNVLSRQTISYIHFESKGVIFRDTICYQSSIQNAEIAPALLSTIL